MLLVLRKDFLDYTDSTRSHTVISNAPSIPARAALPSHPHHVRAERRKKIDVVLVKILLRLDDMKNNDIVH